MNLVKLLQQAGDHLGAGEAGAADLILRRLLKKKPGHADALNLAGVAAYQLGDFDRAAKLLHKVIQRNPRTIGAQLNLGAVLNAQNRYDDAARCYRAVLEIDPRNTLALTNLGKNCLDQNKLEAARRYLEQATACDPNYWIAFHNLGSCYIRENNPAASVDAYTRALALHDNPTTLGELVLSLRRTDRFDDEYAEARRLLANPAAGDSAIAAFETLFAAFDWDLIEQTQSRLVELLRAAESRTQLRGGGLILLNSLAAVDAATVYACHKAWAASLPQHSATAPLPTPVRGARSRLRIGYLSPDFREHSVGLFCRNLIEAHDRSRFEIYCYANSSVRDSTTEAIAAAAHRYADISACSDPELENAIRADRIDILIDLAGHTRDSRIAAMNTRLAPVQITYLGYPNTTGLDTIDYRISDPYADDDEDGTLYSETLLRLPQSFLCCGRFEAVARGPRAPAAERGYVTFGSFNNIRKLTPAVVSAWCDILRQVPNARLVIKARRATEAITRRNLYQAFERNGIDPGRIELRSPCDTRAAHLASYNDIDIALDTFPYHGTTTTCEALWMGVPVVTLVGRMHASRVSYSILTNCNLAELVTWDTAEYVSKAVALAREVDALSDLHGTVRRGFERSILCDPVQFTRQFEQAMFTALDARRIQAPAALAG